MGIPLILAAIILNIPNKEWFSGQYGIASALLWIGVIATVIHVLVFALILNRVSRR